MAKNTLFRNAIGGYNKDDVNAYIADLGVQYSDKENELLTEIKLLKQELEVLPALNAEKERAARLDEEVCALKKENADLTSAIEAQGEKLDACSESLSKVCAEKEALDIRVNELCQREEKAQEENAKLRADIELKAGQLEMAKAETERERLALEAEKREFETRAEEMLVQIREQAKCVIDKANETAELIVSGAKKKANDYLSYERKEAASYSDISSKKKDSLSGIMDNHKSKMDSFFSSITKTIFGDNK